jgi:hypothetical protein
MRALVAMALLLLAGCPTGDVVEEEPTEPVVVIAHVDRADPVPGRAFELTVTVDKADGVEFTLPDVGGQLKGLIVSKQRSEGPERVAGRVVTKEVYTLKAPVSGVFRIPGVDAPFKAPGDIVGTAGTAPILIEAGRHGDEGSVAEEVLRDLKGVAAPDADLRAVWIAVGVVGLIALALAAWFLRRRATPDAPAPIPAHEQALAELGRLLTGDLVRTNDQGPFAYEVSAILRRYLEARFSFGAWRMTTPEVLRALPRDVASRHDLEAAVRTVLEASDYVKFAAQEVPVETLRGWGASVQTLVNATLPEAEVAP